jgi:hypothetical protein
MKAPHSYRIKGSSLTTFLLWMSAIAAATLALPRTMSVLDGGGPPTAFEILSAIGLGAIQLAAIVSFGLWFKAAYSKLPILGAATRYTPGMACALFFVPFAHLFKPGELIEELYRGSDPARLRPKSRRQVKGAKAATFWWYGFLASTTASDIAWILSLRANEASVSNLDQALIPAAFIGLSHLLAAAAALGATRFIGDISEFHRRCAILLKLDKRFAASAAIEDNTFQRSHRVASVLRGLLIASAVIVPLTIGLLLGVIVAPKLSWLFVVAIVLAGLVGVCLGVAFLMWIHRVVSNIRRVAPYPDSPFFSVVGFAIPLFNLIHSWMVFQRIWTWLDRINGGIWQDDSRDIKISDVNPSRSLLVDTWWIVTVAEASIGVVAQVLASRETSAGVLAATVVAQIVMSSVAMLLLYRIVGMIAWKMASIEIFIAKERSALPDHLEQEMAETRATWADVFLPIASTIDQGLRVPEFMASQVELSQSAFVTPSEPAEPEIDRGYPIVPFASARRLTLSVRVALLLAMLFGCAGAIAFYLAFSLRPNTQIDRKAVAWIVFGLGAATTMLVGIAPWLLLARWMSAQVRNANSLGLLIADPRRAAWGILTLREPRVFRDLLAASSSPLGGVAFVVWNISLRLMQTSPIWLALACVRGSTIVTSAAILLFAVVVLALTHTAMFVRDIDTRFATKHEESVGGTAVSSVGTPIPAV